MPKVIAYTLTWSPEQMAYKIYETQTKKELPIVPDSTVWFSWLDTISSFVFAGKYGRYTARRETRQRTEYYWYGYQVQGTHLQKKYLGKASNITLAHLESLGAKFSLQSEYGQEPVSQSAIVTNDSVFSSHSISSLESSMLHPLLMTKLHHPHPRTLLVARHHLIERLQSCVRYPLTLLSAPAGFGKTTLLTQWLAGSQLPVVWLSLEPEDNDPARFLFYLIAALQMVDSRLGRTATVLLHTPQSPSPEVVLAQLVNDIVEYGDGDMVLVLDDYHTITAEPLIRSMAFFLEHLPSHLHLILASRTDPQLPLARLRASGQLLEIRTSELCFDNEETRDFFEIVMGLELSTEMITTLEERTEGWIAGLQLAALSLQGRKDLAGFVANFTGTHRFVLDYLSDEVFLRQSPAIQMFLLATSHLDRLSGPLCDAVTGQEGGQEMLEMLEKANLFVVSLDETRVWYRYHHLFAETLRSYLLRRAPLMIPTLHRQASEWYEQHELPLEAIRHALAIPDTERAICLIDAIIIPFAVLGQRSTVFGFLNTLSDDVVRAHPLLNIHYASLLVLSNQFEAAESRIQEVEAVMALENSPERARMILGYILTNRSTIAYFSGDLATSISLSRHALTIIPETQEIAYSGNLVNAVHLYLITGDVTPASEHTVEKIITILRPFSNPFATVCGIALLAQLQVLQGKLRQALLTYAQVMDVVTHPELLQTRFAGPYYHFGLGSLLRERNDQEMAQWHLRQGLELIHEEVPLEPWIALQGYTALAWLQQACGNPLEARATMDALAQVAVRRRFATIPFVQVAAEQARLALAQENITMALSWAERCGCRVEDVDLPYHRESAYLVLVRVRIAQYQRFPTSEGLPGVLTLLNRLQKEAKEKGRQGSVLEILIVRALVLEVLGEQEAAMSTLEQALVRAEPEGYIQKFVDEGPLMRRMLDRLPRRGVLSDYAERLLKVCEEQHRSNAPAQVAADNFIQITERERAVLDLLLEGASNREIADCLVLSINTVKRHVYNICSKLGVQSRMQAIIRARSLHLF